MLPIFDATNLYLLLYYYFSLGAETDTPLPLRNSSALLNKLFARYFISGDLCYQVSYTCFQLFNFSRIILESLILEISSQKNIDRALIWRSW